MGGGQVGGGQGGWEWRIEAFVKIQKKNYFFWVGGGQGGGGHRVWGQGGCERRSKVFVKIQKKKKIFFFGGGGGGEGGSGWGEVGGGPIRGWSGGGEG